MLNYFTVQLAGDNAIGNHLTDPEKYHFDSNSFLRRIIDIYVALSSFEAFIRAVACDTRSYNAHLLNSALSELEARRVTNTDNLMTFKQLIAKANDVYMEEQGLEEKLGEIPEEFQDPLMQVLMRDPVLLPASKTIVDRSTIARHLLSDPTDPFTRTPLKMEEVVPDTQLKQRINEFIASRLADGSKASSAPTPPQ